VQATVVLKGGLVVGGVEVAGVTRGEYHFDTFGPVEERGQPFTILGDPVVVRGQPGLLHRSADTGQTGHTERLVLLGENSKRRRS